MKTDPVQNHIHFEPVPTPDHLFHPTLTVSQLFINNETRTSGKIVRTFRNDPELVPGRPVWVFLAFESAFSGEESFVSLEDMQNRIIERLS